MRLYVMSDLHLDVCKKTPFIFPDPLPHYDVAVIAGDVREGMVKAVEWLAKSPLAGKPILYVGGNHEFYHHARDRELGKARKASKDTDVTILQDEHIDIDGIRFVGATLWTDYCFDGVHLQRGSMYEAERYMNDHRLIRLERRSYGRFSPQDALDEHITSRLYIERMLEHPDRPRKIVVVTHHAPSRHSIGTRFITSSLNPSYASHLDELVDRATLWIHGHTHICRDYPVGDGRVVANCRGYEGYEPTEFRNDFVVEV